MTRYSHLLSAGPIAHLDLKKHLFQTAMGTNLANSEGTISDVSIGYYEARAEGCAVACI